MISPRKYLVNKFVIISAQIVHQISVSEGVLELSSVEELSLLERVSVDLSTVFYSSLAFILYNQDDKDPTAVLACLIDFSKAFNRQDHNILITKLSDMGVP